jgi:hypothetical protein
MNGQTPTKTSAEERLETALHAAYEALQEAHSRMYDVALAYERRENELLAGKGAGAVLSEAAAALKQARDETYELKPLLAPLVRFVQRQRRDIIRGGGTHGS